MRIALTGGAIDRKAGEAFGCWLRRLGCGGSDGVARYEEFLEAVFWKNICLRDAWREFSCGFQVTSAA
jgi:hypothetical protein